MIALWLAVAAGFVLFELHHLAFYAMFVAAGCVAAALTAVVTPNAIAIQLVVAVVVAVIGAVGVRPWVSAAYDRRHHTTHVARGVHGGIVGQQVLTLDEVGDLGTNGHVQLVGERWLAITGDGQRIPPGTPVVVTAVQGTTLVVWPTAALEEDN